MKFKISTISLLLAIFFTFSADSFSQDVPTAGPVPEGTQVDKVQPPFTNPNFEFRGTETAFAFQTFPTPTQYVTFPIPGYTPTVVGPGTFVDFASSGCFAPNGTFFLTTGGDVSGTAQLWTVNTSTGVATLRGSMTGVNNVNGITYDPSNGLFYVATSTSLYTVDTTTGAATLVGPFNNTGGLMAEIAVDCDGNMYAVDLGLDNTYSVNKTTGAITLIGPLGFNLNFGCGMTFDRENDILYLFGLDGTTSSNALRSVNTTTGTATIVQSWTPALSQFAPFDIVGNGSACGGSGGSETLVLLHDSTLGTAGNIAERKQDRDTLMAALDDLVSGYDVFTFDTTDALPNLSGYKTIILQELSFDDAIVRYLGVGARAQLVAWLNSGTPADKKALLMIGGDNGYNYSRTGSPGRDLVLTQTLMKFVFQADNSGSLAPPTITGTGIDIGNQRTYSTATSGFWPDGCSMEAGATSLYHYTGRGTDDSLAAIGYNGTGYVSATLNMDPRYFTGDFKSVLQNLIGYLVTNGGTITGVQTVSNVIPERFELKQNYPNPFNPTTKIEYSIPKNSLVTLKIYNMLGQEIKTLVSEFHTAGTYAVDFNASDFASGTYFYSIQTEGFVETKKMVLLK